MRHRHYCCVNSNRSVNVDCDRRSDCHINRGINSHYGRRWRWNVWSHIWTTSSSESSAVTKLISAPTRFSTLSSASVSAASLGFRSFFRRSTSSFFAFSNSKASYLALLLAICCSKVNLCLAASSTTDGSWTSLLVGLKNLVTFWILFMITK